MAVLEVVPDAASESVDDSTDKITATLGFVVHFGDPTDTAFDALSHGDIPAKWEAHPDWPAYCKQRTFSRQDSLTGKVVCNYDSTLDSEDNPLDRTPEWEYRTDEYLVPVDVDLDSVQIINKAGDAFDPPVMKTEFIRVARFTMNVDPSFGLSAFNIEGKVNASTYAGASARTVLCQDISASGIKTENDVPFRVLQGELAYRPAGWKVKLLNAGFRKKNGTAREQILINGSPATQPVPLDSSGVPLSATGTPVWLDFRIIADGDFSGLPTPA